MGERAFELDRFTVVANSARSLNLPQVDSVNFRTTVRVPDGGAVVLTGVSAQFEHLKAENSEIVLFLRAKVVQPKRPAAKPDAGNNGAADAAVERVCSKASIALSASRSS